MKGLKASIMVLVNEKVDHYCHLPAIQQRNIYAWDYSSHFPFSVVQSDPPLPRGNLPRRKSYMNGAYRITFEKSHFPLYHGPQSLTIGALDTRFTAVANFEEHLISGSTRLASLEEYIRFQHML